VRLCDISLVELWNSSDVVLALCCVFILTVSVTSQCFRSRFCSLFERQNMKHCVHSWWEKYVISNPVSVKNILFLHSFPSVTSAFTVQLFLIFVGTEFEVLTVVSIHNVVWMWTPYSLAHSYECFGGAFFWVCLHRSSRDGGSISWPKPQYAPASLHSPKTQKTIISDLNILHFPCIVSLLYSLQSN